MKKSTILKSLGLKSNTSTASLLKKTMQVTAFTFSCLVALPSFVQTADAQTGECGYNGGCVTGWGDYDPWGDWDGWVDDDWGCQSIGCDSSDDGGSNPPPPPPPPEVCTATEELNLRTEKQSISGCYGDPGSTFNMTQWYQTETGFWNTFLSMTFPILPNVGWYDAFIDPITDLANGLISNNGDQYALYNSFADAVWGSCSTVTNDGGDGCEISAVYLIQSYYPNTSSISGILNSISNFFGGSDFVPTVDYDSTWGGRLTRDVNNFKRCQLVYRAWDEQNCNGNL